MARNILHKFNDLTPPEGLVSFVKSLGSVVEALIAKVTGSKMTPAEEQAAATTLRNQQILNQEEFDRKIQFYEEYESPQAQVRQYKEAGLNPMLLAGSGASVSASGGVGSAGSAPAHTSSGDSIGNILGSIFGLVTKTKQLQLDRDLGSEANDIRRYESETRRIEATNYGKYLEALTTGQNQKNDVFYEAFGKDMQGKDADIKQKEAQATYLMEVAGSEVVRRRLMESGIRLNDANTAVVEVQKAILKAQEVYSDRYFKAIAEISEYQSTILSVDADVASRLSKAGNDLLYHRAVADCADMIFKAGMDQDIWEGDAFKQAVDGRMTKKDWTQTVMSLIKTLVAGGAVVGSTAIRSAAKAVVPPVINPSAYQPNNWQVGAGV